MLCIFPTASSKGWDEDFHQIVLLHSKQTGLLILMSQWFSISLASCPLQDTHSPIDDLFLPVPVTGFYWNPLSLLPCPFHVQLKSLKSDGVGFAHFLLSLGTCHPSPHVLASFHFVFLNVLRRLSAVHPGSFLPKVASCFEDLLPLSQQQSASSLRE